MSSIVQVVQMIVYSNDGDLHWTRELEAEHRLANFTLKLASQSPESADRLTCTMAFWKIAAFDDLEIFTSNPQISISHCHKDLPFIQQTSSHAALLIVLKDCDLVVWQLGNARRGKEKTYNTEWRGIEVHIAETKKLLRLPHHCHVLC